jgi:hypothetical protein
VDILTNATKHVQQVLKMEVNCQTIICILGRADLCSQMKVKKLRHNLEI